MKLVSKSVLLIIDWDKKRRYFLLIFDICEERREDSRLNKYTHKYIFSPVKTR